MGSKETDWPNSRSDTNWAEAGDKVDMAATNWVARGRPAGQPSSNEVTVQEAIQQRSISSDNIAVPAISLWILLDSVPFCHSNHKHEQNIGF
ncbi:hypothetical protein Nepgr_007640 [Nepenthes gracilis]|uniref:Uncharacterized protein n=1 Tax=Nepenthes gracilis TaxID=150966 RepID=A0AAD3S794_NEPGR|nr:hypothetical protein Nepgr_007640 [Nepenthes gracilis]